MIKKIILGIIGLIVVISVIGAMSGGSKETQKVGENNSSTAPTNTTTPTQETYKVGDQVQSGEHVFSVNAVRKDTGTGFVKPKSGSVYLIPNVTVENKSNSPVTVSTLLSMYVKDSEGNEYTPTLTSDATGKVDGELLAGEKVKGDVGFEVPSTATGMKFYYEPTWLGSEKTIIVDLGM